jgi:hypothetical protein
MSCHAANTLSLLSSCLKGPAAEHAACCATRLWLLVELAVNRPTAASCRRTRRINEMTVGVCHRRRYKALVP